MSSSRTIRVFPADSLAQAAADEFVRVGNAAIADHRTFTVALSGGSTPRQLFALLAKSHARFPWRQTELFFGDERHVPPDHADSNYRMVKETLLSKITIPPKNVHRVKAENRDAHAAAAEYDQEIMQAFRLKAGEFPRFDLILLGMGPDGHVASLFPGSQALKEQARSVVANWVEKFKAYRITLTFPVLNHADEVAFLVAGADKADMVFQVLEEESNPPLPAQKVRPAAGELLWLLDEPAASRLNS